MEDIFNFENELETSALVPKGEHLFLIKSVKDKDTKSGNGLMLVIDFIGISELVKNRKHTEWLILKHDSVAATSIGRQKVKQLLQALEHPLTITDYRTLIDKNVVLKIAHETGKDGKQTARAIAFLKAPLDMENIFEGDVPF